MYLYTVIIFFLLAVLVILKVKKYKCEKWYVILSMILLGSLAAIRASSVGNDTKTYLQIFNMIAEGKNLDSWDERFEIGYVLLNRLLAKITQNEQALLVLTSAIIYVCISYFIAQYSKDYFLSIYLFVTMRFMGRTMNEIRFCIAVAILFIAYDRLCKRHLVQFAILVAVAALFHKTAIVFAIVIAFKHVKCNAKIVALWIVATIGCYFMTPYFIDLLFRMFPSYQSYSDRYITTGMSVGVVLYIAVWGISLAVGYVIQRSCNRQYEEMNMLNLIMMCSVTIYVMSMYFTLLDRVAQYFGIFVIIYIPNCIHMIESVRKRYFLKSVVGVGFMTYFWGIQMLRPEWNTIGIYKTFWMQ